MFPVNRKKQLPTTRRIVVGNLYPTLQAVMDNIVRRSSQVLITLPKGFWCLVEVCSLLHGGTMSRLPWEFCRCRLNKLDPLSDHACFSQRIQTDNVWRAERACLREFQAFRSYLARTGCCSILHDEAACWILEGRIDGTIYLSSFISYDGRWTWPSKKSE